MASILLTWDFIFNEEARWVLFLSVGGEGDKPAGLTCGGGVGVSWAVELGF